VPRRNALQSRRSPPPCKSQEADRGNGCNEGGNAVTNRYRIPKRAGAICSTVRSSAISRALGTNVLNVTNPKDVFDSNDRPDENSPGIGNNSYVNLSEVAGTHMEDMPNVFNGDRDESSDSDSHVQFCRGETFPNKNKGLFSEKNKGIEREKPDAVQNAKKKDHDEGSLADGRNKRRRLESNPDVTGGAFGEDTGGVSAATHKDKATYTKHRALELVKVHLKPLLESKRICKEKYKSIAQTATHMVVMKLNSGQVALQDENAISHVAVVNAAISLGVSYI